MNDVEFRSMLNLFMVADGELPNDEYILIRQMMNRKSVERGYADWIDAYHEFDASPEDQE